MRDFLSLYKDWSVHDRAAVNDIHELSYNPPPLECQSRSTCNPPQKNPREFPAHHYPLTNQAQLQLCNGADYGENHFAHRGACVDTFVQRDEIDSHRVELFEGEHEVLGRSCEPIEPGDQDRIEPAAPCVSHQSIQLRPAVLCARDADIDVLIGDGHAAVARASCSSRWLCSALSF